MTSYRMSRDDEGRGSYLTSLSSRRLLDKLLDRKRDHRRCEWFSILKTDQKNELFFKFLKIKLRRLFFLISKKTTNCFFPPRGFFVDKLSHSTLFIRRYEDTGNLLLSQKWKISFLHIMRATNSDRTRWFHKIQHATVKRTYFSRTKNSSIRIWFFSFTCDRFLATFYNSKVYLSNRVKHAQSKQEKSSPESLASYWH